MKSIRITSGYYFTCSNESCLKAVGFVDGVLTYHVAYANCTEVLKMSPGNRHLGSSDLRPFFFLGPHFAREFHHRPPQRTSIIHHHHHHCATNPPSQHYLSKTFVSFSLSHTLMHIP